MSRRNMIYTNTNTSGAEYKMGRLIYRTLQTKTPIKDGTEIGLALPSVKKMPNISQGSARTF